MSDGKVERAELVERIRSFAKLCSPRGAELMRDISTMIEHDGEALKQAFNAGHDFAESMRDGRPPEWTKGNIAEAAPHSAYCDIALQDAMIEVMSNGEKIWMYDDALFDKSLAGNGYRVVAASGEPSPPADVADMVFWCRLSAEQWVKMDGADSIRAKRLREIADTLVRLSRSMSAASPAREDKMRDALKPFAELAKHEELSKAFVDHYFPINLGIMNGNVMQTKIYNKLKVSDFWRARAALSQKEEG